jgi:hypothetical protein
MKVGIKRIGDTLIFQDKLNNTSYPLNKVELQMLINGDIDEMEIFDRIAMKHEVTVEDKVIQVKGVHKEKDIYESECST